MRNIENVLVLPPKPSAVKREIPPSSQHDNAVREAMLAAVTSPWEVLCDVGRVVIASQIQPLSSTAVDFPFRLPNPIVACSGDLGSNNDEMRKFAYDAYDCLLSQFGENQWVGWNILGYIMPDEEPTRIRLSVFVGLSDLIRTVVE